MVECAHPNMSESQAVIRSEEDLDGYFEAGAKPRDRWGVGLEYERFGVLRDGVMPVPFEGPASVETVIGRLVHERGWAPTEEAGRLLGARDGETRLTLEPGCQLELSGGVHRDLEAMRAELAAFLAAVDAMSRPAGIAWLGVGMQPFAALESIPWIPKKRYAVMRDYLPTRGRRGIVMMKQTACIQANLDYGSERDAMDKMRTALGISPLITAVFANSPLTESRPNGHLSRRAWAWRDTDPDRCGLLPFPFRDDARFADYLQWALDVPMFFVARGDDYRPARGVTFRRFIREGFEGTRPTVDDFELHLTTLFPEVRLKRYLEMRGADSCDPAAAMALAAIWKGILYDDAARSAAWALVENWSFEERVALLDAVCTEGPEAPLPGGASRRGPAARAGELATDLLRLARAGLESMGAAGETIWIERFERRLRRDGGCPARRILTAWETPSGRDPRHLVEELSRDTLQSD
jgi:glutamate--cysteine ligase